VLVAPFWQHLQISVGDLFELVRPAVFLVAALISASVLAHSRRRALSPHAVVLWTLGTFVFPHILLPLYLAARIFYAHPHPTTLPAHQPDAAESLPSHQTDDARPLPLHPSTEAETPTAHQANDAQTFTLHPQEASKPLTSHQSESLASHQTASPPRWRRTPLLPALYLLTLLALGTLFFYLDYNSLEGHLARANNAKLLRRRERAIHEYAAALRLEDDPHTHKLLALELSDAGYVQQALDEFLAARRGGEPDDLLPYRIGLALDTLNRPAEAAHSYREFLQSRPCTQPSPDTACADAQHRLKSTIERSYAAQ
jgi:hypothetical protein